MITEARSFFYNVNIRISRKGKWKSEPPPSVIAMMHIKDSYDPNNRDCGNVSK